MIQPVRQHPLSPSVTITAGVLLIAGLSLLVYWPALHGGFVLDDDLLVTENPLVQAPVGLYRIWLTREPVDYWPLTNSFFWLQWHTWGANPAGYHIVNLSLHIVDCLLLWAVIHRLVLPGGFIAALLFAVHPLNVESVAWIAQLKNVLSLLFFLLSIWCYLRFDVRSPVNLQSQQSRRAPKSQQNAHSNRLHWWILSLTSFVLAMLSKGSVAVLPAILLLIIWWQFRRLTSRDFLRLAPFFLVAMVFTLVNIWFQRHDCTDVVRSITLLDRFLGAGAVIWFYLYKSLLPLNLAFVYPAWHIDAQNILWWLPLLAALAVTALLAWYRQRKSISPLLFAWLFFCFALVPVMGFVDVGFMKYSLVADHYGHIALLAVVAAAAVATVTLQQHLADRTRGLIPIGVALIVMLLSFMAWQQSQLYASPFALYQDTIQKNPDCSIAHDNLAIDLAKSGQIDQAIEHCQTALRINSNDAIAHNSLGLIFTNTNRLPEAIELLETAIRLKPNDPVAHFNFGNALAKSGHPADAIPQYQTAVQLRPSYIEVWNNLAAAYADTGRRADAVATAEKALALARYYGKNTLATNIAVRLAQYQALPQPGNASSK